MEDMQEKLNAVLSNPQMMSQIMSLAQSLGSGSETPQPQPQPEPQQAFGLDPGMLQKVMGLAQKTGIDKNQQTLLTALSPYLSRDRILKLEKAMRAARLANAASSFLGSSGNPFFPGR